MVHERVRGWISDGPIRFMCFHFKFSPSEQDQLEKGEQPRKWTKFPEIKTEFPKVFSLRVKFRKVVCQCRYFWHNELQHIPRKPMISLSIPHNFAFTRVKLQSLIYSAHDRPISFKTVVIAEMLSILVQARIHTGFHIERSSCIRATALKQIPMQNINCFGNTPRGHNVPIFSVYNT